VSNAELSICSGKTSLERGTPTGPFEGVQRRCELYTIELGCVLQRLFSTFPNSWPGAGLVLIRVGLGLALFYFGSAGGLGKPPEPITFAQKFIAAAGGIFLLAGLWTPAMGVLTALDEVSIALSFSPAHRSDMSIHVFLALIAASLAMLGPGAWSVDARLFGRKRIDMDRTAGKPTSPELGRRGPDL
jgi:uncharacterized membrane protein YphA (DoxX/SURF4 family)